MTGLPTSTLFCRFLLHVDELVGSHCRLLHQRGFHWTRYSTTSGGARRLCKRTQIDSWICCFLTSADVFENCVTWFWRFSYQFMAPSEAKYIIRIGLTCHSKQCRVVARYFPQCRKTETPVEIKDAHVSDLHFDIQLNRFSNQQRDRW